jgi:hypothetical protein
MLCDDAGKLYGREDWVMMEERLSVFSFAILFYRDFLHRRKRSLQSKLHPSLLVDRGDERSEVGVSNIHCVHDGMVVGRANNNGIKQHCCSGASWSIVP